LCIISIFSISIIAFSLENFKYNDVLDRIAKVLGLLIISISKEKIEDELIAKSESYNYAVIGTVMFYLINHLLYYCVCFSSAPRMEVVKIFLF
jgi:hypothetical protein